MDDPAGRVASQAGGEVADLKRDGGPGCRDDMAKVDADLSAEICNPGQDRDRPRIRQIGNSIAVPVVRIRDLQMTIPVIDISRGGVAVL